MSLSVNNYYQKYYNNYDLTSGGTDPSRTASTAAGLTSAAGTDSASFSDIAKLFFNLDDESRDSAEDYTATYTPAMMRPTPQPLSSDQMKSLLEEIQTNTSVSGSGTASSSSTDNTLTSLQSLLGGYDLSSADNDEISALFQSVQSLPFSLSYADTAAADSQSSGQASGIPTMLQAMGGFPPPFAWGLNHTAAGTDETAATEAVTASTGSVQATGLTSLESGLTKEDIQSILATLQSSLSLPGSGDEASASTDNPLSVVKAMLSKTNFMASSDSELSSLFSNILQKLA